LKTQIDKINYNIKHQIIVLDDKKLTQKSIEEKILKQKEKDRNFRKNTTIIVVNDTINISSLVVLPNIRIIHIKKGTPTTPTTPTTKINTLTHQCTKIIPHNFDAEITKEQGTNKNITILYDNDADLVAILKYAVLSNVVVFIESSTD
jgi:6-phosphofructokinase